MKNRAEDVQAVWNEICLDLQRCSDLTIRDRQNKAQKLVDEFGLPKIALAAHKVAKSAFCNGLITTEASPAGFRANFDWFINRVAVIELLEGKYDGVKEVAPPENPAPHDETYWFTPKPNIEIGDDEFLRCQIGGQLQKIGEQRARRRSWTPDTKRKLAAEWERLGLVTEGFFKDWAERDDFCQDWLTNGGNHPWASEAQIEVAKGLVMEARAKGDLPKSFAEFKLMTDKELARWSLKNPYKALPGQPLSSFREFRELKEKIRRGEVE